MATRKVWIVEEIETDGKIAHRQSIQTYTESEDGKWGWNIPSERMTANGINEWE